MQNPWNILKGQQTSLKYAIFTLISLFFINFSKNTNNCLSAIVKKYLLHWFQRFYLLCKCILKLEVTYIYPFIIAPRVICISSRLYCPIYLISNLYISNDVCKYCNISQYDFSLQYPVLKYCHVSKNSWRLHRWTLKSHNKSKYQK